MIRLWNHLVGVTLAGQYRLEQYLAGDEAAGWYLTTSRSGERAALKLMPAASRCLDAWQATRLLSHSNLLPMFDCGHALTDSGPVIFAVFEYPDDNLAAAMGGRQLDESDARETLAACLAALDYVHAHGMVHGSVDAQHVVAVGDRVKLASDTLRDAAGSGITPEDDRRALYKLVGLPYPESAKPARPAEAPLVLPPPVVRKEEEDEPAERSVPTWVYGAAAGLVIALGMAFVLKPSKPAAPVQPPTTQTPQPAPTRPIPATVQPPASAPHGDAVWRVVAYTYNRYKDAEKKARTINARYPGLHATVFTPKGKDRRPYFVALGGRMTHAEALNLRHVAQAKGLPRDTFVRNYSD